MRLHDLERIFFVGEMCGKGDAGAKEVSQVQISQASKNMSLVLVTGNPEGQNYL